MTRLPLADRVAAVCRLASLAQRHFEVYRVYSAPESRQRLWDALDDYADFVNLDEQGHRALCILYVTALFETKDNTLHLRDLIGEIAEGGTAPDVVKEAEAALASATKAVKKVRIIRHNAIAHRSASISYNAAFDLAEITIDDLGALIANADAVAKSLAKACGVEPVIVTFYAAHALDRLFTDVGRQREPS